MTVSTASPARARADARPIEPRRCVPQLTRLADACGRGEPWRAWSSPAFDSAAAFLALSPGVGCVLEDSAGRRLTHQRLGAAGLSVQAAWNGAAAGVIDAALRPRGAARLELWARDATIALGAGCPRGLEVRRGVIPPAGWLAHPQLFSLLHSHFTQVLRPRHGLAYLTRDLRGLFVLDATDGLAARFAAGLPGACVMRYSVGFPLIIGGHGGGGLGSGATVGR
ncbi:hypothetical protein [Corynebacterium liangguodongii]|uniref:Uncharacterized protein n=1 Tax=Corynebacterium liangguodongii TaxID=2079535 RepID=A0A2S0WEW7_9CORY|nr:hypothetical protein [Corynebacterium liangguodongii]AWB84325.1 hypothetical protein C3E79_07390 [Corynebacterium liangguodongii]PWB99815.1 hypothetical protein DF219_03985 [Corynebacterium liangguodongii]